MSEKLPSNKLSIYLIKQDHFDPEVIFKDISKLKKITFPCGDLYLESSHAYKPDWIEKFFGRIDDEKASLFNSNSKAILLCKLKSKNRLFALSFGAGFHLLNNSVWEENFGLKVSLNLVDPNSLKSIDKKNMSSTPKHTREQISWNGEAADFGIDIEQDLIQAVTGKSKNIELGATISGKDSVHASVRADISNVNEFLEKYFDLFESEDYKTTFPWIDQIKEIRDRELIARLDSKLVDDLKSGDKKAYLSVPEIIEWSDVSGFKYKDNQKSELFDDVELLGMLQKWIEENTEINLENIRKYKVFCYSSSSGLCIKNWKLYNCLNLEIQESDLTYLLSNGKWYEITKDFVSVINKDFKSTNISSFDFPVCKGQKEDEYNKLIANKSLVCLDRQNINYGGGYSKIEFCDLLSAKNEIIHVKKYGGSSVLSHLFSQGVVSGELFLNDPIFRDKVNNLLPESFKFDSETRPEAQKYQIIFGIISSSGHNLNLPFFSKVTLRNTKKRLETLGYHVSIAKILEKSGDEDD